MSINVNNYHISVYFNADGSVHQQQSDAIDSVDNIHWTMICSINNLFIDHDIILITIKESLRYIHQDIDIIRQ